MNEIFKIDSIIETLEILEDEETLESVRKGMEDIEEGNIISLDELIDMGCKMKYELVFSREFDMIVLQNNPLIGKPLRFGLKGFRSLRVGKYRIIYKINDKILLSTLKHRKDVYG